MVDSWRTTREIDPIDDTNSGRRASKVDTASAGLRDDLVETVVVLGEVADDHCSDW